MKILCLIDSLASGGAERQMSYLATGLKNRGLDVILCVFSDKADFYKEYIESRNVEVRIVKKGFNRFKRIWAISNLIKEIQPDVVISYKDGVNIAACIAKIFTKFKLIVSERNTTQTLSRYERIKFWSYKFADVIIPNSYSQKAFIDNYYSHLANKVIVITNAIDTDKFPNKHEINKNHRIETDDSITVLTTARVVPQKNVLNFLEAVKIIKNGDIKIKFKWYGSQIDPYYQIVKNRIIELGIEDYIEFFPQIKDVYTVYEKADIYCLPSVYEGFPNVVCEAMSCGLPIICSNVCDNPMIVENQVNGLLFNPMNPKEIAEAINKLTSLNEETRISMGKLNNKKIKDLCSQEKFVTNYINVIDKL